MSHGVQMANVFESTIRATSGTADLSRKIGILLLNTEQFFGPPMQVHRQVMKHLGPSVYRIVIATNSLGDSISHFDGLRDAVIREYNLGVPFKGASTIWAVGLRFFANVPTFLSLLRILWLVRRERVDIIHVASEPRALLVGIILSVLSRTALVVHAHVEHRRERFLKGLVMAVALRRAAAIVAISQFVRQSVVRLGIDPNKVWTVLNVVDLDQFHPLVIGRGVRGELGIDELVPLIGTVGRINADKGQKDLVKALVRVKEEFPDVKAMLVGWADPARLPSGKTYEEELRAFSADHQLADNVVFAGPRTDVPSVFAAVDVVVIPSRWDEPLGLVVIEAMSSGKPVIATRAGGIPELITEGTGILVPKGRPMELAEEIIGLLKKPAVRQRLGRNARKRAEQHFYESRAAEELEAVYASALTGKAQAPERP